MSPYYVRICWGILFIDMVVEPSSFYATEWLEDMVDEIRFRGLIPMNEEYQFFGAVVTNSLSDSIIEGTSLVTQNILETSLTLFLWEGGRHRFLPLNFFSVISPKNGILMSWQFLFDNNTQEKKTLMMSISPTQDPHGLSKSVTLLLV